jgi:hypothetical protein
MYRLPQSIRLSRHDIAVFYAAAKSSGMSYPEWLLLALKASARVALNVAPTISWENLKP